MVDSGSMSRNSRLKPEPHTGCPIHYLLEHRALTLLIFKMEGNSGGKRAGKTTEVPNSPNIDFSIACHVKANLITLKYVILFVWPCNLLPNCLSVIYRIFSFELPLIQKIELKHVIGNLSSTLTRKHKHAVLDNSNRKVAASGWSISRLLYLQSKYKYNFCSCSWILIKR